MKKEKIIKRLLIVSILFFAFAPVSLSKLSFGVMAQEETIISGYQEWDTDTIIDGYVTVEEGATLVIKKGVTVTFKKNSFLIVYGNLYSKGTKKNPVRFRQEGIEEIIPGETWEEDYLWQYFGYAVEIRGKAHFKNTDISGGGNKWNKYIKENSILNKAIAYRYEEYYMDARGAIQIFDNAKMQMDECYIHGNITGIFLEGTRGENVKVNKTIFDKNPIFDVVNYRPKNSTLPDFKYNWWRKSSGPEDGGETDPPQKYISGKIDFSNWLASKEFKDPVILIPGILGSEKEKGELKIDPIFHMYDNLYEEFDNNSYDPSVNLFTFPYEWRNSNIENAKLLKIKIQEIKKQANWPSVDIVAHSMGGLLAREYIESDYYQNDIDQLVTLGTPNNGAPEAYLKWEAGAFLLSLSDIYFKKIFYQESVKNGYNDIFHYVQNKPIISVKELLPVYSYLYGVENSNQLRTYPNNYPINTFLENINSNSKKNKLLNVEIDKIIGNVNDDESTIAGFNVLNYETSEFWKNGYPDSFYTPALRYKGIKNDKGDGTVPLESAKSENLYADKLIEINSSHVELPTNAQKDVVEILTGIRPETEIRKSHVKDIFMALVFSPIDIQVVAPDGKRVGKNFETGEIINEIDGAYYTGSDTENEFLTIPNPIDGEYKILTQGTGEGEYKIEAVKISEDENTQEAKESVAEIIGIASLGQEEEKTVVVEDDEVVSETKDTTPPTITGSATIQPNENGWYNSDVTIHFDATDNESGIDSIAPDIVLATDGENQSAIGTAKDKAGNESSFTVSGINIDKTGPEINIFVPEEKKYLNNLKLEFKYDIKDTLSGLKESKLFLDENNLLSDKIDLSLQNLGDHKLKIFSEDKAGNIKETEIGFKIATDSNSIIDNVNHYFELGLIKDKKDVKIINYRLKLIENFSKIIEKFKNNPFIGKKIKNRLIENLEAQTNKQLGWLIEYIERRSNLKARNKMDFEIGRLLIDCLEFVKYK